MAECYTARNHLAKAATVYTSFTIKHFRLFDHLTVEPLARVNVIAGKNNVGKTALLEALWLHTGPNNPDLGMRLSQLRGIPGADPRRFLHDLFSHYNSDRPITLTAKGDWGDLPRILRIVSQPIDNDAVFVPGVGVPSVVPRGSQEIDVSAISSSEIVLEFTDEKTQKHTSAGWLIRSPSQVVNVGPNVHMTLSGEGMSARRARMPESPSSILLSARHRTSPEEDVARFGEIEKNGFTGDILECLREIDPRIQRLVTINAPPPPMIYVDVGTRPLMPVGLLGDGFGRFLSMAIAFQEARNGTLLIDEVENGLHYSVLVDVWKSLNRLAQQFNVQVFATTHSYECMVAARDAFKSSESQDVCIHRISRRDDNVVATTYPFDALDFTLDYGAEIR